MNPPPNRRQMIQSFLLGGLLPVVAFSVAEEVGGTLWGIIAGIIFGIGEVAWEWKTQHQVSVITWAGNLLILLLGVISLLGNSGIWFKMQPALIEGALALILIGSLAVRRPLLLILAEKQGIRFPAPVLPLISGLTLRVGFFLLLHASLATWAAFRWSTASWALLKGVGFTGSFIVYMLLESWVLRKRTLGLKAGVRL